MHLRSAAKTVTFWIATVLVTPLLLSYALRRPLIGRDRAFEASSQTLSLVPGLIGQYLRRAFYARVLARCHRSVTIEFGVLLSKVDARLDEQVYVGPRSHLGLVHLERDVLIGPGVQIPSGGATHGTDDVSKPIRDQPGQQVEVRIGAGSWIGAGAVILADVGCNSVVGAGAVVTRPVPDDVVAAGVPAIVVRVRSSAATDGHE